ncbi:MAG: chorismate synthase [Salibacteraceae bacterium]|jgi:chorismate synthase
MSSSFGHIFKLTTFGESHGVGIGGVIEGCPAGLNIDLAAVQLELDRRKPGQSDISTPRSETDLVVFYSGIFEGKTTGTPIGFFIKNKDHRSKDYSELKKVYRPSHADFTYESKFGIRDYRGGGRSSARETACRVVGGAVAKQVLAIKGIEVLAYTKSVGKISLSEEVAFKDIIEFRENLVKCPNTDMAIQMEQSILEAKNQGDSLGGVIHCVINGISPGLGEPIFDKYNALLAQAMLSINAVKGFEIGSGFLGCSEYGSQQNDSFFVDEGMVKTNSNNSGGIQGGISNGSPITFNVAFKPVATIQKAQETVSVSNEAIQLAAKGRHDPCVVPRAIPIVEAMAAMVSLDLVLRSRVNRIDQL